MPFDPTQDTLPFRIDASVYVGFDTFLAGIPGAYRGDCHPTLGANRFDTPDFYNQSIFSVKLFTYYLRSISPENISDLLYKNIRDFFMHDMSQKNPLNGVIVEYIDYDSKQTFFRYQQKLASGVSRIKEDFTRRYDLRDPLRIHDKFFRFGDALQKIALKKHKSDKIFYKLLDIQDSPERAIGVKDHATRSVIIALTRFLNQCTRRVTLQFGLTTTTIILEVVDNYGRGLLTVNPGIDTGSIEFLRILQDNPYFSSRDALAKMLQRFPYELNLVRLLEYIATLFMVPVPPANSIQDIITERFSKQIRAFEPQDFKLGTSVLLIHFLNGFAFLTQIFEIARYLPKSVRDDRLMVDLPIATAMAIAKCRYDLRQLYAADVDGVCINPAAIRRIADNPELIMEKMKLIDAGLPGDSPAKMHIVERRGGFTLFPVQSAKATADFLKAQYGSGEESDSDDSVYSISEVTGGMSI